MSNVVARSAVSAVLSLALAACTGTEGPAGPAGPAGTGVTVTAEAPGANCALGGVAVTVDGGTPTYVCNGPAGANVDVVAEPPGSNCVEGGFAVSSGAGAPVYVCSGVGGADGTTPTVTGEPAGANCQYGGIAVQVGPAGAPSYVCNGAPGADGATPTITSEPPGVNCAAGGVKIQLGTAPAQYVCNGASVVVDPCVDALYGPIRDPWGTTWDGSERGLRTLSEAKAACEAIGGRLPIATELLRVSAVQAGGVGETYDTNYLWTLNPSAPQTQIIGRMSDGTFTFSSIDVLSRRPYRCVCPAATPAFFDEHACSGPPGATCSQLSTEGGRYHVDNTDRAPLPKSAAIWECAFAGGHLADPMRLLEGIAGGLPNGSGAWLHTADDARYNYDVLVKWAGSQPAWPADASNITVGFMTDFRPFRCVGLDFAAEPYPVTIANEFVGATHYKGEVVDTAPASWPVAHDTCWARGGHLPRATELGELIQQGLPGGSATWLWTSDQEGYNGTQFLAATISWAGTEPRFAYGAPANDSWAYKTDAAHPHRCIYYPLDTAYAGPTAAQCSGGCAQLAVGGGPATMWLDNYDRSPANVGTAARVCLAAGGHLASERDLTEAIRAGLPNGSGAAVWLHTSDLEFGEYGLNVGIVHWTATEPSFTDLYGTYATWGSPTDSHPYRCVWTNELR